MDQPKLTSLEAALRGVQRENSALTAPVMASVYSPEVFYDGHGMRFSVVFRELSEGYKQLLRYRAISEVESLRRQHEESGGFEWRNADMAIEELRNNTWDRLLLFEAMRDPEDHAKPACDWFWVEQKLPSEVVGYLMTKYREWEQTLSPDAITPKQVEEFVEELKKNSDDLTPIYLWQRHGSAILWACALYMAGLLRTYQTDSSSDTSSSDRP